LCKRELEEKGWSRLKGQHKAIPDNLNKKREGRGGLTPSQVEGKRTPSCWGCQVKKMLGKGRRVEGERRGISGGERQAPLEKEEGILHPKKFPPQKSPKYGQKRGKINTRTEKGGGRQFQSKTYPFQYPSNSFYKWETIPGKKA